MTTVQRILEQAGGQPLKNFTLPTTTMTTVQRILEQVGGSPSQVPAVLVQAADLSEVADVLRETADEETVVAIEAAYAGVVDKAPQNGVGELDLTIPSHDRYARAALQLAAMAAYMSAAFVVGLAAALFPPLSAALWMSGYTPSPQLAWKATGKAYDRIFSPENNHVPPEPPTSIW